MSSIENLQPSKFNALSPCRVACSPGSAQLAPWCRCDLNRAQSKAPKQLHCTLSHHVTSNIMRLSLSLSSSLFLSLFLLSLSLWGLFLTLSSRLFRRISHLMRKPSKPNLVFKWPNSPMAHPSQHASNFARCAKWSSHRAFNRGILGSNWVTKKMGPRNALNLSGLSRIEIIVGKLHAAFRKQASENRIWHVDSVDTVCRA